MLLDPELEEPPELSEELEVSEVAEASPSALELPGEAPPANSFSRLESEAG